MKPLTIGQVAKLAGVGVETMRFYERNGLVAAPPRNDAGYRQYPEDTPLRVRQVNAPSLMPLSRTGISRK